MGQQFHDAEPSFDDGRVLTTGQRLNKDNTLSSENSEPSLLEKPGVTSISSEDMEFEGSEGDKNAGAAAQIQLTQEQVMNKMRAGVSSMFAGFASLK